MTPINGAKHDVEDILASIRTSIADRSPGFDADRREMRATTLRGRSAIAEEAMEFELPAIFKSLGEPVPARTNLLGRLSEVLSANGSGQERERSRTVIPFDPPHGRMIEPPPMALEPASAAPSAAAEKIAAENDGVKRIMPTFFDTRINRMGEMSRTLPVTSEPAEKPAVAEASQPPRLPGGAAAAGDQSAVEDAAAQLLRPILKQWLTENMPKIVEKALKSETGDGGRGGGSRS